MLKEDMRQDEAFDCIRYREDIVPRNHSPDFCQFTEIYLPLLVLFQIFWMAAILLSPLKKLTRRLAFVLIGVVAMLLLSEISKFNLHEYLMPPKAS